MFVTKAAVKTSFAAFLHLILYNINNDYESDELKKSNNYTKLLIYRLFFELVNNNRTI